MSDVQPVCDNRAASHRYILLDRYEAGLVLKGSEVKSIRAGRVNLRDSYVQFRGSEPYLLNAHISPYPFAQDVVEERRPRKLLLNKGEIERLLGQVSRKGYTLIPLSLYFKKGRAKVQIALSQAKNLFDKREDLKKRMHERDMARALKARSHRRKKSDGAD